MPKWVVRTTDGKWYLHELRGAVYLSWVSSANKEHAVTFSDDDMGEWLTVLGRMDKRLDLEAVAPSD